MPRITAVQLGWTASGVSENLLVIIIPIENAKTNKGVELRCGVPVQFRIANAAMEKEWACGVIIVLDEVRKIGQWGKRRNF